MEYGEDSRDSMGYVMADMHEVVWRAWGQLRYEWFSEEADICMDPCICSCYGGIHTRAVTWEGGSMLPYFPAGMILIFDCSRVCQANDYVIFWDHLKNRGVFRRMIAVATPNPSCANKQLEVDTKHYIFRACNNNIPDICKQSHHELLGVLIATHMNFE